MKIKDFLYVKINHLLINFLLRDSYGNPAAFSESTSRTIFPVVILIVDIRRNVSFLKPGEEDGRNSTVISSSR